MENIEKLKESLNIVHDYLYVQILGKAGEDALFELNNAITIVENLTIHVVVKSLPCEKCNDNGGFGTIDGWETCTKCL